MSDLHGKMARLVHDESLLKGKLFENMMSIILCCENSITKIESNDLKDAIQLIESIKYKAEYLKGFIS